MDPPMILWLPPEAEDEEDDNDADDGDDGGDGIGEEEEEDGADTAEEWRYLRASSGSSGDYRNREKSYEEQKKAMKSVVDGHFRALVAQLLQVENLRVGDEEEEEEEKEKGWLEIITALSWEAATLLKPDMSRGGGMDPGGYVKIKCVACGERRESCVVRGVVCKKNVAHRRMVSRVDRAKLLILGGSLEYERMSPNLLSSFDTLLEEEMVQLKRVVARIDSHRPDLLLVEKSVSRFAQEYLLGRGISLVLNIKRPLLERIARCTDAEIIPSVEHLSADKMGCCGSFHVDKLLEEHGSAGQGGKKAVKTLMYFEGCPKPLGCTVIVRGAGGDELKKVKHVVQYSVFAAYHLALETSFLADEGASVSELPLGPPLNVALLNKSSSTIDRSISTVPGFSNIGSTTSPMRTVSEGVDRGGKEFTRRCSDLDERPLFSSATSLHIRDFYTGLPCSISEGLSESVEVFEGRESIINDDRLDFQGLERSSGAMDVCVGSVLGTLGNSNEPYLTQNEREFDEGPQPTFKEEFPPSPSDHQSILVSLSSRCVWKGTVCERSHLFRIKYYGSFDKPLGRFLHDHLFDQGYLCSSCDMPSEAHVHCYTHQQGTLTISVKRLPDILLPGEKDGKIWMWHRCLRCPRSNGFPPATRRIVMSDAAWGLSFGKFLELSFSNNAAASRVASCGHSLHRDCLRFYGFGRMVACFYYASIDVHSVCLPPSKLDFSYKKQEWVQKEAAVLVDQADLLFSDVLNSLHHIAKKRTVLLPTTCSNLLDLRMLILKLEEMMKHEKEEFEEFLKTVLGIGRENGNEAVDVLEIYSLQRQLVFQSYIWDRRFVYLDSLCNNSTDPPEALNDGNLSSNSGAGFRISDPFPLDQRTHSVPDPDGSCAFSETGRIMDSNSQESREIESELLEPKITVRRAFSEGQFPPVERLSDTLEAAWTGENGTIQRGFSCPNSNRSSFVDLQASLGLGRREAAEEQANDPRNPVFSPLDFLTNPPASVEDSISWIRIPFVNFYRLLNENFTKLGQKLGGLGEYNPIYISSFRDTEQPSVSRILLPVGFGDTVVPVYDDEPSSIIAYALMMPDYQSQKDGSDISASFSLTESSNSQSLPSLEEPLGFESCRSLGSIDEGILSSSGYRIPDPPAHTKVPHTRVFFSGDGPLGRVKYTVICYYAKLFESLRRMYCASEKDFVRSLSRCKRWGAQGGKSNVFFAKTMDDRLIIKQVTKTELESFIKFASAYFNYLSESSGTGSPTCMAKLLGIYQVTAKHVKGGKEMRMDVLVTENILFERSITRLYDLKGSSRSRYNPDSSGENKVLLDQNLIEAMPTSPIFVGNKAKRVLERAVWNDTSFLASIDVMDYSLLVGVDEEKHELVLGIIDFMRQYTWDKHLETWVKASGILGGPKNVSPTVISPKQYKKRFRKAMTTYFFMVPDQWSPPPVAHDDDERPQ